MGPRAIASTVPEERPLIDPVALVAAVAEPAANIGVLATGLLLGVRHGIDWDHIAAITDITSST
jgi:high-affinity nickel permease